VRPNPEKTVTTAYLGLGSNLGDRAKYLSDALRLLRTLPGVRVTAVSPVYETKPVGLVDQPDFLNLVVALETDLPPAPLLAACQGVEYALGRKRDVRWGPRTLDIDLLCHGSVISADPALTLPHPRLTERAFVLVPLSALAPELKLGGKTARELAAATDRTGVREYGPLTEPGA
jgi:2-amino-4-hydroxy-6-hydroxymethyldihydropteridine diphosphokinase